MKPNKQFESIKRGLIEAREISLDQQIQNVIKTRDLHIGRAIAFEEAICFLQEYCEYDQSIIDSIKFPIKHKAIESIKHGRLAEKEQLSSKDECDSYSNMLSVCPVFLLNKKLPNISDHDQFSGQCDILLPFPMMIFEVGINSHRLMVIAHQENGCRPNYNYLLFSKNEFVVPMAVYFEKNKTIQKQIEAVCILLDSGVAEKTVTRAPVPLNKKREKTGKQKIQDFFCINIANRSRYSMTQGRRDKGVRLHFRRGHWRHYETHKTWIKWTLVGDEELGFIDKGYKL